MREMLFALSTTAVFWLIVALTAYLTLSL